MKLLRSKIQISSRLLPSGSRSCWSTCRSKLSLLKTAYPLFLAPKRRRREITLAWGGAQRRAQWNPREWLKIIGQARSGRRRRKHRTEATVGTEDVLPWAFCVFFGDQARDPPSDTLTWPLHDSAAPRQQNKAPLFNSSVCTVTSVRAFLLLGHDGKGTGQMVKYRSAPRSAP